MFLGLVASGDRIFEQQQQPQQSREISSACTWIVKG
jgi:hypothetical protein